MTLLLQHACDLEQRGNGLRADGMCTHTAYTHKHPHYAPLKLEWILALPLHNGFRAAETLVLSKMCDPLTLCEANNHTYPHHHPTTSLVPPKASVYIPTSISDKSLLWGSLVWQTKTLIWPGKRRHTLTCISLKPLKHTITRTAHTLNI